MDQSVGNSTVDVFFNPYSTDVVVNRALLVYTIAVSTIGVIGNTLVIGAVVTYKPLRRLSNAFIVNLAVADLLVATFISSFGVVGVLTHGKYFYMKPGLCEFVGVVCIISCSCSMWSVAGVSINRYVAICHRLNYPQIFNRSTMILIIPSMWTICFCIDLPNLLGWGGHSFDPKIMLCTYDYMTSYSYTFFFIVTVFLTPLTAVIFSYTGIILYARRVMGDVQRISKSSEPRHGVNRADRRLLRTVMIIMVTFFVMWCPYSVVAIFDSGGLWPRALYVFTAILPHLNSCVNSILYATTHPLFRKGYVYFIRSTVCGVCLQVHLRFRSENKEEVLPTPKSISEGQECVYKFCADTACDTTCVRGVCCDNASTT